MSVAEPKFDDRPLDFAVDGDTIFRIGSTTKTFTGTAMMRLVERGDVGQTVRGRGSSARFRFGDMTDTTGNHAPCLRRYV